MRPDGLSTPAQGGSSAPGDSPQPCRCDVHGSCQCLCLGCCSCIHHIRIRLSSLCGAARRHLMLLQQSSDCRMRVPSKQEDVTSGDDTAWAHRLAPPLAAHQHKMAGSRQPCLSWRPRRASSCEAAHRCATGASWGRRCLPWPQRPFWPPSCWSSAACLGPERPLRSSPGLRWRPHTSRLVHCNHCVMSNTGHLPCCGRLYHIVENTFSCILHKTGCPGWQVTGWTKGPLPAAASTVLPVGAPAEFSAGAAAAALLASGSAAPAWCVSTR